MQNRIKPKRCLSFKDIDLNSINLNEFSSSFAKLEGKQEAEI
jgi:hypothetical protein